MFSLEGVSSKLMRGSNREMSEGEKEPPVPLPRSDARRAVKPISPGAGGSVTREQGNLCMKSASQDGQL